MMLPDELAAAASRLCTACGMCCNGVLFHIVRLQPGDSVKKLERLGMKLNRKKHEPYFTQPCGFLKACTCTIYAARPVRCRAFECQQLKRLAVDETTEAAALLKIEEVKCLVAKVEALLVQAGNWALWQTPAERYAQVMADEATGDAVVVRQQLVTEMQALNKLLNAEFRLDHG